MVCDRCKSVLKTEFQRAGIVLEQIDLGEILFADGAEDKKGRIREILNQNGFEWIADLNETIIVDIKKYLLEAIENGLSQNLSTYLSQKMNKEYSVISKIFSAKEGLTIEKYFILLKMEKVKEEIQMDNKIFSEIAYDLNYKSSSHLAKQFKAITGMSMTEYRNIQDWDRRSLDQIV